MSDTSVYGRLQRGYSFEKCKCCHSARGRDAKWCKERQPPPASLIPVGLANLCRAMHHHRPGSKILAFIAVVLVCSSVFNQKWLSLDVFSLVILHVAKLPSPCRYLTSSVTTELFLGFLEISISRKRRYSFLWLRVFFWKNQRKRSILYTELGCIHTLMSLSGLSLQWSREIESPLQWNCCVPWL